MRCAQKYFCQGGTKVSVGGGLNIFGIGGGLAPIQKMKKKSELSEGRGRPNQEFSPNVYASFIDGSPNQICCLRLRLHYSEVTSYTAHLTFFLIYL